MSVASTAARFVGQLRRQNGRPLVFNPFQPDDPAVWARLIDPTVPDGAFVDVVELADGDGSTQPRFAATLMALPDSARAEVVRIAIDHGLDPAFPRSAEEQVQGLLAKPGLDDPSLDDLTELPFVTIDGADTRDLDQALYVERDGQGFVVYYALADAGWYVKPGTPLFTEALRRGASYYLPGFVIPMLPRPLSEGLVSLNEGVERRAFVFRMPLDRTGHPTGTTISRGRIRSRRKLSFERVQAFFDDPKRHPFADPALARSLEAFRDVGELRVRHAEHRHVVHYRRSELEVDLSGHQGMRFVAAAEVRGPVEKYNEQLSLLCNVEGARMLLRGDRPDDSVQPVYRVHPRPDPRRIAEFEALTAALARIHGLDRSRWIWRAEGNSSLAEYLAALPIGGHEGRIARAVHRQAVMLNVRSSFSEEAAEHYGVGAEVYARFSSPMREIVGVFVHKEAWEKHAGPSSSLPTTSASGDAASLGDEELRAQIVDSANRAKEMQKRITKDANRLVIDQWFGEDLARPTEARPGRTGTVMGLTRQKVHVLLDEPPLEVKVYVADLQRQHGDALQLDEDGASLERSGDQSPLVRIGDAVSVRAQERDGRRDRWILGLAPIAAAD